MVFLLPVSFMDPLRSKVGQRQRQGYLVPKTFSHGNPQFRPWFYVYLCIMLTAIIGVFLFLNNLGGGELVVILLFVLMFFGSKKVPELARGLGKGMREVKDAMNGIQRDIQSGVNETTAGFEEEKKAIEDIKKEFTEDPMSKPRS